MKGSLMRDKKQLVSCLVNRHGGRVKNQWHGALHMGGTADRNNRRQKSGSEEQNGSQLTLSVPANRPCRVSASYLSCHLHQLNEKSSVSV
jgi:hypothetical protein